MKTLRYSSRRNPKEEVTEEKEIATPLAFGDVAFLEDDGLTDEQRKRALTWLKKRSEHTEGVFDAEDAHLGISLLPGWSSTVQTVTRAVSLNSTTSGTSFPAALVEAGLTQIPSSSGRVRSPTLGEPGYGESNIAGVRAIGYYDDPRIIADVSIAKTFREYDPKKVKVKSLPAGRWATDIKVRGDGTAVIEKPTLVFAEQGGLTVTNAEGKTETLKGGKSAWKILYGDRIFVSGVGFKNKGGMGLQEAAQGVVPPLEQKVETRAAFARSNERAWGGALCPVCFQRAAVTPTSQHMVDHRHTRPGYGYNVAPCEGNRFAPYMLSPEGSAWMLERLEAILPVRLEKLRNVIANPTKQTYTTKVNVRDEKGDIVYDLVPSHKARYRGEKNERMEVVPVKYGHKLYDEKYAKHVKTLKAELAATRNAIPFYAAAVRVWKKGLDEMEPILRGIRETDKPALPPELRNNPRARRVSTATLGERVSVFRNLHTGTWSMESASTGRIVAHPDTVLLEDVRLVSRDAGREDARRTGAKNVHALATGTLVAIDGPAPADLARWTPLYYNPFKVDTFVEFMDGKVGNPVRGSRMWFAAADHRSQYALDPQEGDPGRHKKPKVPKRKNGFLASLALVGIGMAAGVYVEEQKGVAARVRSSLKGKDKVARAQFDRLKRGVLEAQPKTSAAAVKRAAPVTDATWSVEEESGGKGNLHTRRIAGLEYVVFERNYGKGNKVILLDLFDPNGKHYPRLPGGEGADGEGWKSVSAAKKAAEKHALV